MTVPDKIQPVVTSVSGELVDAGAEAVVLTGSYARGDSGEHSDIDLHAIGSGPAYRMEEHGGWIVSVSWHSVEEVEGSFLSPASAGAAVPGWRAAIILHDSHGVAAELVERARGWTWDEIGDHVLNAWVADELTRLAEEVFKLVQLLEQGRLTAAAVQRNILALRVPVVMATRLRLLYDSENVLWDMVAASMGSDWAGVQSAMFGMGGESFRETCVAALNLYSMAREQSGTLFDDDQMPVVSAAVRALESLR